MSDDDFDLPTEGISVIRYCPMKYECPKKWETLNETENPDVRHCDTCGKDVTLARTDNQLAELMAARACVSYFYQEDDRVIRLTGVVGTSDVSFEEMMWGKRDSSDAAGEKKGGED